MGERFWESHGPRIAAAMHDHLFQRDAPPLLLPARSATSAARSARRCWSQDYALFRPPRLLESRAGERAALRAPARARRLRDARAGARRRRTADWCCCTATATRPTPGAWSSSASAARAARRWRSTCPASAGRRPRDGRRCCRSTTARRSRGAHAAGERGRRSCWPATRSAAASRCARRSATTCRWRASCRSRPRASTCRPGSSSSSATSSCARC